MAWICWNVVKYDRYDLDILKWLNMLKMAYFVGNGLNVWGMAQLCLKRLKYVENGLPVWETA